LDTVCKLSKLAAQVLGKPSASVKITSVGMPRMLDVMRAIVTLFSAGMAESRVRTSTGRFSSGA
jgi:hypothetical protein